MAYAVCMRARIIEKEHWRDNSVTGTLEINDAIYRFKTRKLIVQAVNSRYSNIAWKPQPGDEVIIDGDIFSDQVVIDHIEQWRPQDHTLLGRHDSIVERLIQSLPAMPEMTKALRVRSHQDCGTPVYIARWGKDAQAKDGRAMVPAVVSAIMAEAEIRFACRAKMGGKLLPNDNVAILPLLASTLGIPHAEILAPAKTIKQPKPIARSGAKGRNKWIPGQPYTPDGMPDRTPFDEFAPTSAPVYDDIPF